MNILIVGYGQIGKSINGLYIDTLKSYTDLKSPIEDLVSNPVGDIYTSGYTVLKLDSYNTLDGVNTPSEVLSAGTISVMHVCYGYSNTFIKDTLEYIEKYKPKLTIIHSTVPVNTTAEIVSHCDYNVVHSPVMGVHPHLTESILTFTKIIGGVTKEAVLLAKRHFKELGIKTVVYNSPEESEASKLLDTTYYGWNILYMKHVKKFCKERDLDFENVYTTTNEIYNEGYTTMRKHNVVRPVLKYMSGKIGGHCVIPNMKILEKEFYPAKIGLQMNEDDSI